MQIACEPYGVSLASKQASKASYATDCEVEPELAIKKSEGRSRKFTTVASIAFSWITPNELK